jgi:hypothetical protein
VGVEFVARAQGAPTALFVPPNFPGSYREIRISGSQTGLLRDYTPLLFKTPCQCDVSTPHFFENIRQQIVTRCQIRAILARRVIHLSSEPLSTGRAQSQ